MGEDERGARGPGEDERGARGPGEDERAARGPSLSPAVAAKLAAVEQRWPGLLGTSQGRRILTRLDPQLFALVYLSHHLRGKETSDLVSFSEMHEEWDRIALEWVSKNPEPKAGRHAFISPRASAKSTVWYLLKPMWAAAHGHVRFVAAFSDSASQAEGHLSTFKREIDTNELLREDYPDLCQPLVRKGRGNLVADNRSLMQMRSGFVFAAKGIDSATLGLKVGEARPDLIILDDIEPSESNYSEYLAAKRLSTLQNAILPLNDWARVVFVGTVTMNGSLVHQLAQSVQNGGDQPAAWIGDERIDVHYYPALLTGDDGEERSLWPEKWPLEYLKSIEHTRSFALNMQNRPVPVDGAYWSLDDIEVRAVPPTATRHVLSVDPAVTQGQKSDYTGLAVLSYDKANGRVYVRKSWRVKLSGSGLRGKAVAILNEFPEVSVILVEVNQGGDLWSEVFADLPVKYVTVRQHVAKEVRAGWLLEGYQRRAVVHAEPLPNLDLELIAFGPRALHDDQVDAVGSGYTWLTGAGRPVKKRVAAGVEVSSY